MMSSYGGHFVRHRPYGGHFVRHRHFPAYCVPFSTLSRPFMAAILSAIGHLPAYCVPFSTLSRPFMADILSAISPGFDFELCPVKVISSLSSALGNRQK